MIKLIVDDHRKYFNLRFKRIENSEERLIIDTHYRSKLALSHIWALQFRL